MLKALSQDELVRVFGDPAPYIMSDGMVAPAWERRILRMEVMPAPLPLLGAPGRVVTRFRAHYLISRFLQSALTELHSKPELWATINDWGGVYMFRRNTADRRRLSSHCWGLGPDMDVGDNAQGDDPQVHPGVIEVMNRWGFAWGGTFPKKDGMHWEFADLARLTGGHGG